MAACVGGAFGGGVAIAALNTLQVAHALREGDVQAGLPQAPVLQRCLLLLQDDGADGVESDASVGGAGAPQQDQQDQQGGHLRTHVQKVPQVS